MDEEDEDGERDDDEQLEEEGQAEVEHADARAVQHAGQLRRLGRGGRGGGIA